MATLIQLLFHLFAFLLYAYAVYYDVKFVVIPHGPERRFAGKFKYLTFWNLLAQLFYFGFVTLLDIGSLLKKPCQSETISQAPTCRLKKFRNAWYNIITFPVATFVCSSFWSIYAYDRELVFPRILDAVFPSWLNHVMHTVIFPVSCIELILVPHHLPHRKKGISVLGGFILLYIGWIYFINFYANFWIYPVLEVLNSWQRIIFIVTLVFILSLYYLLGEWLTKQYWGKAILPIQERKRRD